MQVQQKKTLVLDTTPFELPDAAYMFAEMAKAEDDAAKEARQEKASAKVDAANKKAETAPRIARPKRKASGVIKG